MKLIKNESVTIHRYDYSKQWCVYVEEDAETFYAYIRNESMGVAELMFGWAKVQHPFDSDKPELWTLDMFLYLVEGNIEDHIKDYMDIYN